MVTNITITPSTQIEVLSTADAKDQLRLEASYTDEDDLIDAYIEAAVSNIENYINAHVQPKTLVIWLDSFHTYTFETYPLTISSVEYYQKDAASLTTLSTSDWYVTKPNAKKQNLVIKNTPASVETERPDVVKITATIGYASASNIPTPIIQAVKLQVSDMYERREDRAGIPITASQNLLRPYRYYI